LKFFLNLLAIYLFFLLIYLLKFLINRMMLKKKISSKINKKIKYLNFFSKANIHNFSFSTEQNTIYVKIISSALFKSRLVLDMDSKIFFIQYPFHLINRTIHEINFQSKEKELFFLKNNHYSQKEYQNIILIHPKISEILKIEKGKKTLVFPPENLNENTIVMSADSFFKHYSESID